MRQHFVPRTYLKNFATMKKSEYEICVRNKSDNRCYQTNIKNIAVEKDIYRLDRIKDSEIVKDENEWEKFYAQKVEPDLSKLLDSTRARCENCLIRNGAVVIDEEIKRQFVEQICFQLFRGKDAINESVKMKENLKSEIREEVEKLRNDHFREESDAVIDYYLDLPELWRLSYAMASMAVNEYSGVNSRLGQGFWVLYRIACNKEFVTSDNPIVIHNMLSDAVGTFQAGLGYDSTVLYYPISSQLLLAIYKNGIMFMKMKELNNKIQFMNDESFVDEVNKLQFRQCNRQIYAKFMKTCSSI